MKTKIITAIGVGTLALSLGQSSVGAQEKGTVTASALNVRSGPGTNTSIKGCLYKGDTVAVLEKGNGWLKVQLSNKTTGWVSDKYIKIGITSVNTKIKCKANLNVRSGPGINYSVKTSLSPGQVVVLLSQSNGWYKVKLSNGTTGWASSSYVEKTDTYGKSTASLNVRSGPGTNYSIKTALKNGEIVTITKSSNSWYQIKTNFNITGWVSSKYINITTELPSDNTNNDNSPSESKNEAVVNLARAQLGKPYVWGGNGPNSFDCSGFTRYVYLNAIGVSLPRVSYEQAKAGTAVGTSNLKKGDLLHFATVTPGRTTHVGIYIGNNQFIHASGSQTRPDKVKIDSLSGYYGRVLLGARRF